MFSPKKVLAAGFGLLIAVYCSFFPASLFASQKQYFDWGPYYQSSQVLGFSFSSLENLPDLKLPDNIKLPSAGGILPDSPFYPLEKVVERVQLTLTFDPVGKEQLRLEIATERLAEAKTLIDKGKTQAASQALDDYAQTLTAIAQNLPTIAQRNDPKAADLINKTEQVAVAQIMLATSLSLTSPPAQAENWTQAASAGREILDKVADGKGQPAIPEDLSTGLQQLKEQGLISAAESNKLYSLKNRGEVREELNKLTYSGSVPPSEIVKLDEAVGRYYPDVQNQQLANLQVLELRSYQTLPQPTDEIREELQKWQADSAVPPPNNIKPYLWYNRAQDLAQKVDLANFSQDQQTDLVKYYPQAAVENPTYSPPPSPSPAVSPSPAPTSGTVPAGPTAQAGNQTATPSAATASPAPSPASVPADPYLKGTGGALPGQPTYILKQLGEGLNFALTFDPVEKARLKMQQAERRLAEAEALSRDVKQAGRYESSLQNYRSAIADAANRIKKLKKGKAAEKTAEQLEIQASRHAVVFEKGLLPLPAKNPALISDVIKTAEDAMDRSADALDRPALPPALSSRLGDLTAQGLILAEEAADLVRSASREEAREKIRKLVAQKIFPLADAKKLDEAQTFSFPADYNQLVEVRKVEELQNLRSVQTDLAQTPTFKAQATTLGQKEIFLSSSFDPTLVKVADLAGRENLVKTYEKLAAVPRPINSGQFGAEATPGAQPVVTLPLPRDAVLSTCPEGATFKQSEGCVWADSNRKINDYDQYKCDGPRQYYSFAARKCVAYEPDKVYQEDAQPICPVSYTWSWSTQSCQTSRGGILPYPSPSAEPEPKDDEEREKRSKSCPESSSYQPPNGCVWDDSGKSVYDPEQYRCTVRGQYYSFEEHKCVPAPKEGEPYPKNTTPVCKEEGSYWNWSAGKCLPPPPEPTRPLGGPVVIDFRPPFIAPNSPFYIFKQAAERVQLTLALTAPAREQVTLSQAEERLAEAADALKRNDTQGVKKAINAYTSMMQNIVADVSKESLTQGAKDQIAKRLKEESAEHNLLLEKLQALSPAELDTPISAAVSASILGVDKAADIAGEPAIPDELKSKIEALPEKMISEEDKKALLEMDSRVDARLKLGGLIANGALAQTDASFLNEDFDAVDPNAKLKVAELQKLAEIASATESKEKLVEKVEKNEEIAQKLQEFERTFAPGQEVPAEIRPYVRLTRINEVAQTIRPDIIRLDDFRNRKDVLLAVATLQEEFKPTYEAWRQVEDFRRRNPGSTLPPDLARVEALSYSLGIRQQAGPCYLPSPPFAANTPCPAPGAAIPITSYTNYSGPPVYTGAPALDKDGKPLVYGQGPKAASTGICPSGYHWMYDSNGWCMADNGNYGPSSYTPSGPPTPGYTPYSPYYNAPGSPPATFGYPIGDNSPNDGCPYNYDWDGSGNCIPNSYPNSPYSYSPPSYYGTAPSYYTTTPPSGTVPGSGPKPTAPGQCPSGFHWMSDSGGWCMADGPTYVPPGGTPSGSTPWCWSASPPPGGWPCISSSFWDQSSCSCKSRGSPDSVTGNCGPGYSWNGYSCQPSSGSGSTCTYPSGGCPGVGAWYDYSSCSCKTTTYSGSPYSSSCNPPSGGCGYNSYWDYGSCYCRASSTYSGGGGPTPGNSCQGLSCGGGAWLDYSTCSCRYSGGSGTSSTGSTITCYPPSAGCPGGWYDYGTCSCKTSSSTSTTSGGSSSGSCPSGSHWMSDNGGYCMSDSTTTSGGGGTTTSGSCPSGYHWMSDSGGWCMQDGGGSSTTSSPAPSSSTTTSSEPAPNTSTSTESAPPPSEPQPAPESAPPPSPPPP